MYCYFVNCLVVVQPQFLFEVNLRRRNSMYSSISFAGWPCLLQTFRSSTGTSFNGCCLTAANYFALMMFLGWLDSWFSLIVFSSVATSSSIALFLTVCHTDLILCVHYVGCPLVWVRILEDNSHGTTEQERKEERLCTGGTSMLYAFWCICTHSAGENLFQEESDNELL